MNALDLIRSVNDNEDQQVRRCKRHLDVGVDGLRLPDMCGGNVVELYGASQTYKSTLAALMVRAHGGSTLWIDLALSAAAISRLAIATTRIPAPHHLHDVRVMRPRSTLELASALVTVEQMIQPPYLLVLDGVERLFAARCNSSKWIKLLSRVASRGVLIVMCKGALFGTVKTQKQRHDEYMGAAWTRLVDHRIILERVDDTILRVSITSRGDACQSTVCIMLKAIDATVEGFESCAC